MKTPHTKIFIYTTLLLFLTCFTTESYSQLSVSQIFSDGMVLQREHNIPVWGKAESNTLVSVKILNNTISSSADSSGEWLITIPAMSAGGRLQTMTITSGAQSISIINVYVGDVWLASGQSNMELAD